MWYYFIILKVKFYYERIPSECLVLLVYQNKIMTCCWNSHNYSIIALPKYLLQMGTERVNHTEFIDLRFNEFLVDICFYRIDIRCREKETIAEPFLVRKCAWNLQKLQSALFNVTTKSYIPCKIYRKCFALKSDTNH